MRGVAVLAVLVLAPLADALSQQLPLQPGERVRVTVPSLDVSKQKTSFQRVNGDTLVVSSASYALSDVTRLEVWRGRSSRLLLGMGIGFAAGTGAGAAIGHAADCPFTPCAAIGAFAGAGAGLLIGGVVGALIKTDRWEEVPLDRLRVSVVPGREGFRIAARIAF